MTAPLGGMMGPPLLLVLVLLLLLVLRTMMTMMGMGETCVRPSPSVRSPGGNAPVRHRGRRPAPVLPPPFIVTPPIRLRGIVLLPPPVSLPLPLLSREVTVVTSRAVTIPAATTS